MLFKKSLVVPKLFSKGGSQALFRKSGQVLGDVSPILGLVNPSLGVSANVIGKVLSKF